MEKLHLQKQKSMNNVLAIQPRRQEVTDYKYRQKGCVVDYNYYPFVKLVPKSTSRPFLHLKTISSNKRMSKEF